MRRYWKVFWLLLKANLNILTYYRSNFYAGAISTVLWVVLALVSISVLTYQAPEIGGWNKYELFSVQGVYSIILALMYFAIGDSLKKLTNDIMWGHLDLTLVKPIDSQFLVSFGEFRFQHLARVAAGICLLSYAMYALGIQITFFTVVQFCVFTIMSITIIYSIWLMITTLAIWLTNIHNLHELFVHTTGLTRYPLEILKYISQYFMYIMLPLVVVTTVPAQVLLQRINSQLAMWSVIIAVSLFLLSRRFWQFALKHYTSASS